MKSIYNIFAIAFACIFGSIGSSEAFATVSCRHGRGMCLSSAAATPMTTMTTRIPTQPTVPCNPTSFARTSLFASENDDFETLSESSQTIVGAAGTLAALIVFYSEYTLKMTGCGVPAGPFGLFGLAEGFSYLGVLGLVAYSAVTKIKTGSGLPAGPGGLLGAAEGLSYLAILVGIVVLVLQVTNYGYIPNAVPMEGGMCS